VSLPSALRTALRLGRVSNLPTVWTNVLVGVALNGGTPTPALVIPLAAAVSLFYVAGMFLNDAFDHRWDAQHRPERPIPSGQVAARTVFLAGFALMAGGLGLLAVGPGSPTPALGGLALAAAIILYDASHKKNPLAPLVMGLCRVAVYVIAALAVSPRIAGAVWLGSGVLLLYLIGLTLVAKHEHRNPRLPQLVGKLIAGICLLDAILLLAFGYPIAAAVAAAGFPLTRLFQRYIAGT
jgi:4-hydroxybenzoate polyprenyltransferase